MHQTPLFYLFLIAFFFYQVGYSQNGQVQDPFKQLGSELPTPNAYRTASGAPGEKYWQQQVDYRIYVTLDETYPNPKIKGKLYMTYHNNSPHTLEYLWLQLDQNIFQPHALSRQTLLAQPPNFKKDEDLKNIQRWIESKTKPQWRKGGYSILKVTDEKGEPISYHIVETNMKVLLPTPLKPNSSFTLYIEYEYFINDATKGGRSGYEFFEEDSNYIFTIAQFFPRACAYTDVRGWQNDPYIGTGEFALEFGNYYVEITVPEDHILMATGDLLNPKEVLTPAQFKRWNQSLQSDTPVTIVSLEEALANQKKRAARFKTWKFRAQNVRDFAFASSRKFIWDAAGVTIEGKRIRTQALYPPEAYSLWSKYANHAIRHALKVYSRHTIPYPYPHATAVHGPVWGMEYPMMAFCGGRPSKDGTYSAGIKYATISVIIHEVGHNFFPMIINNDERQWAWLDEGFNSFLEYLAEIEFEPNYPVRRGPVESAIPYMKSENDQPIMTRPQEITQLGANAYTKVAAALTLLRESILGRDLFDEAFRTYAKRWAFKRPEPADFFRTMEDASGVDLDWFWRAWFFGTDHVDIAITDLKGYPLDSSLLANYPPLPQYSISVMQNLKQNQPFYTNSFPHLKDEFSKWNIDTLSPPSPKPTQYYYTITFENKGGIPSPLYYRIFYIDGTYEDVKIGVEVWSKSPKKVTKEWVSSKMVRGILFDPENQLGDAEPSNNWLGLVY